jgi:hypothetical protein
MIAPVGFASNYTYSDTSAFNETYSPTFYFSDFREFHDVAPAYVYQSKKKQKKPYINEDACLPQYHDIHTKWVKPADRINRMMFCRSGKLAKRIRRIRKDK